jgi:hypothetical protein
MRQSSVLYDMASALESRAAILSTWSPASSFTGQSATPAQQSDPVTVLRQLRAAGQYWLYW